MGIRVLLVDDHKIMREGLRSLLEKEDDLQVVAEAGDGRTAVELARKLRPNVVIMDIGMPVLNGIEAARQIASGVEGAKIVALSLHSDRRLVAEALHAGAIGYLVKDCACEELCRAVRTVAQGQTYLSPEVAGTVVRDYLDRLGSRDDSAPSPLTPREREVLQLLAEGQPTKRIAQALHISIKTVETHRARIMSKLDIDNIAGLTKYAIREGITALQE